MTVVSSEDEHVSIVYNCSVGMSRTWPCFLVSSYHSAPLPLYNTVSVEVVHSIESIVASEYIDVLVSITHSCVAVTRRGRLTSSWEYLGPCISTEIKAEEVISAISTVIASKYVEVIVYSN